MGRWTWLEFKGRENHTTRVYSAYRHGTKPAQTSKKTTAYQQQIQHIKDKSIEADPWKMFDDDITTELSNQMITKHVILMLDINQNADTGSFSTRMRMTYARNRLSTNTQLGCVVGVGCLLLLLFLNCELKVKLMYINFTTYYIILTTYNSNI